MDTSKFLSKALGIYLLIISISMLSDMQFFIMNVKSLINDAPLMFVTGFFTLILGIVMVLCHNVWHFNWRVIITIVAWLTLLKGTSLIFYPHFMDKTTLLFTQNIQVAYGAAWIDLFLGLLLCYFGYRKKRT